MNKRNFYIYQEDLIRYEVSQKPLAISQLVEDLNKKYGQENMRKLRTVEVLAEGGGNKERVVEERGYYSVPLTTHCGAKPACEINFIYVDNLL